MQKLALLLLLITATLTGYTQNSEQSIHQKLDSIAQEKGLVGFGVSVFTEKEVLLQKGYGFSNSALQSPYTANTIQNIGSISKTFIGVSLMKAIELGYFEMDTPVNNILPFKVTHPKHAKVTITVGHLATHTSGIVDKEEIYEKSYVLESPNALGLEGFDKKTKRYLRSVVQNKKISLREYLSNYLLPRGVFYSSKNFLKKAPGTQYEYSNIASALAAYCIMVKSGLSFADFTQKYVFDIVGMPGTGWSYNAIARDLHAKTYAPNGMAYPEYSLITYPDGGLRTSIVDLTSYMQACIRGFHGEANIILPKSYQKMLKARITEIQYGPDGDTSENYGYFWEVMSNGSFGHNGGDPGIFTLMYYSEEYGTGTIFFTNTDVLGNPAAAQQVKAVWQALRDFQKEQKL